MTLSPTTDSPDVDFEFVPGGVDPGSLRIHANVRLDAQVEEDADLLASVRRRGVRTAISAYRDGDGHLVVLRGQRRTLAAVLTGRARVPVLVEPEPSEADRIADQVMENDQRAGLRPAEHVAAYEQMEALGFTAEQIAEQMATPAPKVRAGLAVAKSAAALKAIGGIEQLDLLRGQVFAEFSDNVDALRRLEAAATGGNWDHTVQRLRDDRRAALIRSAAEDSLAASGVKVLRGQDRIGTYGSDGKVRRITALRSKPGGTAKMQARHHEKCRGHAAYVEMNYHGRDEAGELIHVPETVFVCKDPEKYGHELLDSLTYGGTGKTRIADLEPEEQEAERVKNRLAKANNAAMRAATTLRMRYLRGLLDRKKAPAGSGKVIAAALFRDSDKLRFTMERASRTAHDLFGMQIEQYQSPLDEFRALADDVSDARGELIALVNVLAAYEENMDPAAWRIVDGGQNRYLRFLASTGYELSPVEEMAAGLREVCNVDEMAGVA